MTGIETIYDYFEDHQKAATSVNETRPLLFGVLCFALGGVSLFISHTLSQRLTFLTFSWSSLLLTMLWQVSAGFVLAAVLHMIMDIQGRKGSAGSLFVLLGLANLVWALAVPFILLARLFFPDKNWPGSVIFLGVGFLVLSLKARSLRDNYHVSTARSWVSLAMPYVALIVAALIGLSLALWVAILKVMQWAH
jgi:hypothetical protein